MSKCPICGAEGYMGAWIFECPTKTCQNYVATSPRGYGACPINITVTPTYQAWLCEWKSIPGSDDGELTWSDDAGDLLYHMRTPVGCSWQQFVDYVDMHIPKYFMSRRNPTTYYATGKAVDWKCLKDELRYDGRIS